MEQNDVRNEYFDWLSKIVCENRFSKQISYKKLLMRLHNIPFRYSIPRDKNRAKDGEELRYRFAIENGYNLRQKDILNALDGPCSVLEMLVALSVRCEENIMDDPRMGNRTGQWFWGMITNLGLGAMSDNRFDKKIVDNAIKRFLDRKYEPDGRGGLFTVRNSDCDLRTIEIWYQLCRYLDGIT